jgi:hypothetical protein
MIAENTHETILEIPFCIGAGRYRFSTGFEPTPDQSPPAVVVMGPRV